MKKRKYLRETLPILWPYILSTVLLLILFFSGLMVCQRLIRQNAEQTAQTRSSVISDEVYQRIVSFKKVCDVLTANHTALSFPDVSLTDENEMYTSIHALQKEFMDVMSIAHISFADIEVYYPEKEAIISPNRFFQGRGQCRERFEDQFGGILSREILSEIPAEKAWTVFYGEGTAYMVRQLSKRDKTVAYFILKYELSQLVPLSSEEGLVLIGNDHMLLYSSDSRISEELSQELKSKVGERHRFQYNDETYIAYRLISSVLQTDITIAISVDQIAAQSSSYRMILIALCLACIASLALIFRVMYKRVILPYRYLAEVTGPAIGENKDIFAIARSNLISLKRQQKAAEEEKALLIHLGVGDLLQQVRTSSEDSVTGLATRCLSLVGIQPEQRYLVFAVFHMLDRDQVFESMQNTQKEITPRFVLNNILQDLLFCGRIGVIATMERYFVIIATCQDGDTEDSLSELINRLTDFYQKYYSVTVAATRPLIGSKAEELRSVIRQTMNDVTYLYFWQKSRVGNPDDEKGEELISYFKSMRNLVNRMDNQDYTGAQMIFDQIMQSNLSHSAQDFQITKYRIYGMLDILIAATSEMATEDVIKKLDCERRLYSVETISAFCAMAEQIFMELIDIRQQCDEGGGSKKKVEKVKEYIDAHYTENSLTATSVAEHFGMNSSYVSREFKQMIGCNILVYIQKLRIDEAKKLLKTHSVKDAAQKSGFWDTQSLVRTFKKYEGITPGEYKRML